MAPLYADFALNETDDIPAGSRLASHVRATNARRHIGNPNVDAAAMRSRQERRGETKGTLDDVQQPLEQTTRLHAGWSCQGQNNERQPASSREVRRETPDRGTPRRSRFCIEIPHTSLES
jgi:hypothetical protein